MEPVFPQIRSEAELKLMKFRAYIALGWGAVIMFAFLGVFTGHQQGVYVAVVTSVMWMLFRIVREGIDALLFLKVVKSAEKKDADTDDE